MYSTRLSSKVRLESGYVFLDSKQKKQKNTKNSS